jgi:hypothetical protein
MNQPPARWAVAAAYAVPLCVLPSAIWRLSIALGGGADPAGYLVFLSVLSMALALSTLVLVHRRGERLPARPVTVLALAGGSALVLISVYFFLNQAFHFVDRGWSPSGFQDGVVHEKPGWDVLKYYVPLLAWGPLVLAVAADFRRRHARSSGIPARSS